MVYLKFNYFIQIIEELEEQISEMRAQEASQQQRDLRKIRLTYEILARNELNAKLAEINTFLEERAKEQAANDRKKDQVSISPTCYDQLSCTKAHNFSLLAVWLYHFF